MGRAPDTRAETVVEVLHGVEVRDPYRWLEDGDSPDVREWVAAQNALTRSVLDGLPSRARWLERLAQLMARPVVLSAELRGDTVVVLERAEGAPQPRLVAFRLPDDDRDRPEPVVLIDPVAVPGAAGDDAVAIDWYHVSPDGSLVAYGVSEGGTERSVLKVVRTADGSHLDESIPDTRACSLAWEPDGSGFVYTRYPEGDEYHRTVFSHRLGESWRADPVVWADHPTPQTWPGVDMSPDGRWVLVTSMSSWSRDDVVLLDRHSGVWHDVARGLDGRTTLGITDDSRWLIGITTVGSSNGRLVRLPLPLDDAPVVGPDRWETLVTERGDVVLDRSWPTGDRVAVAVTRRASDSLEWWTPRSAGQGAEGPETVDLGPITTDPVTIDSVSVDDGTAVAVVSGFTMPGTLCAFRPGTTAREVRIAGSAPATSLDLSAIVVDELAYTSADGTSVGIFVAASADGSGVALAGPSPTILTGYGGFGLTMSPAWSPMLAAWCEAGGRYAVAGLRGGSEHGDRWHRAGKREHKQNVFDDLAAAADWLVDSGRTTRERLAIAGGSNGGLLVGAALTRRPDLCRAVWCAVPLLDMVRYPQFLIARLWTEEYGDPDVAEEFAWVHAYSPYHRVVDGICYPAVLLTTAEGDTRVDPLHARKMTARLQAASACLDERPVLLHQEGRAGHGQGKPVGKRAAEQADVLAFFTDQFGWVPDRARSTRSVT